jgi:hypothetical protein
MDPVWADPVTIGFGMCSAAVVLIAALFSTRGNRNVSAFLFVMWATTKVWNFPTGSDAQIYLDSALALLCGLLCIVVMHKDRRSLWPLVTLGVMATWITINAGYADLRDTVPQVKFTYQVASNVLFGIALFVNAIPGGRRGALVVRRMLPGRSRRLPRRAMGSGWGREAPDAISRRGARSR